MMHDKRETVNLVSAQKVRRAGPPCQDKIASARERNNFFIQTLVSFSLSLSLFLIYFWAYIFYYLLGVLGCIRVGISYSFDRDRLHNSHEEKGVLFFWGVHGRLGDYCRPLVN